jgi:hypothetical protein
MDNPGLVFLGICSIILGLRCLYLEHCVVQYAKSIDELEQLLHRSNVALGNEIVKNMKPA